MISSALVRFGEDADEWHRELLKAISMQDHPGELSSVCLTNFMIPYLKFQLMVCSHTSRTSDEGLSSYPHVQRTSEIELYLSARVAFR